MRNHNEERMQDYEPLTRFILRSFKYIYYDTDTLLEIFLISIDELKQRVTDDDVQRVIELILLYFTKSNKNFTEEDLTRKVRELEGKGEDIMSILQEREKKGLMKGIIKGREETKKTFALNMLKDGLPVERVAKYAELPVEKVKELQKKL